MLSMLLGTSLITMNRGEQETLYRQARNLRLHQEIKAQQNSSNNQQLGLKPRHHSYGNIHQLHTGVKLQDLQPQALNLRSSFAFDEPTRPCDDLVLSVLKSPLRDQSLLSNLSSVAAASVNSDSIEGSQRISTLTTLTTTTVGDSKNARGAYLQASEDDLADDIELTMETTELNEQHRDSTTLNSDLSPYGLKFLRRFRAPKFEAHHRRVPTPMRRKHNRGRSKSTADILDVGNNAANPNDEEQAMQDDGGAGMEGGDANFSSH